MDRAWRLFVWIGNKETAMSKGEAPRKEGGREKEELTKVDARVKRIENEILSLHVGDNVWQNLCDCICVMDHDIDGHRRLSAALHRDESLLGPELDDILFFFFFVAVRMEDGGRRGGET